MKFKVGDKVMVKKDLKVGFYDGISSILEMTKYRGKTAIIKSVGFISYKLDIDNMEWNWTDDMLELCKIRFAKSDLKDGDIVTYRNGDKRTVIAENLIDSNGFISRKLNQYTNELKDLVIGERLDIVKVERPTQYKEVFVRKEEVLDETEKKYLTEVISPFRKRIQFIQKRKEITEINPYLRIVFKDNDKLVFPYITDKTMYKGMEVNKKYTLKELGL